ncbi:hypothetical protein HYPSUDRAFT_565330 [Hypholoma sublateritium FD-334 SS-4]|uniref:Uncharacterized protein n=1 Tax=Hypholoma sublateritium (strain FD-334 SS-4) TaxID=945553 RepID=A0A0D2NZ17_HYPSF|nr:hypothetical protein HYPSUDRAFT_565330 [Hypholoma sublateritium FD-334 SS-4]
MPSAIPPLIRNWSSKGVLGCLRDDTVAAGPLRGVPVNQHSIQGRQCRCSIAASCLHLACLGKAVQRSIVAGSSRTAPPRASRPCIPLTFEFPTSARGMGTAGEIDACGLMRYHQNRAALRKQRVFQVHPLQNAHGSRLSADAFQFGGVGSTPTAVVRTPHTQD